VLSQLDTFDAIIDARSPCVCAIDHLPGAINAPVLDDEQRITVGTMYKQVGSFEAKKLGAALVAKNIALHIEDLWIDQPREWRPLIYCWRGGNRSGSMAHILAKIGWPVCSWKAATRPSGKVNAALEHAPALDFKVICGTGQRQEPLAGGIGRSGCAGAGSGTTGGAPRLGAGRPAVAAAAEPESV
jgi:tRNA 2-selenouridine synthase